MKIAWLGSFAGGFRAKDSRWDLLARCLRKPLTAEREYLLHAVRAGDSEARRWLEYLLENHPDAFPDGSNASPGSSAAIHRWLTRAREALAVGEEADRPDDNAASTGGESDAEVVPVLAP